MFGVTEIYICKWGQRLEDGILEVSHDIHTRDQAAADALELYEKDRSIYRIAYYAVKDSGAFRLFHTFTNEDVVPPRYYFGPLPMGVRPTVFLRRMGWLRKAWSHFKAFWW